MNQFIDDLRRKNLIFKRLTTIDPKTLGTRKKAGMYLGVDLNGYYAMILRIEKKSRVLRKEAEELMELHKKLESAIDTRIMQKYLFLKAPLCSKAKTLLENNGWKVWEG